MTPVDMGLAGLVLSFLLAMLRVAIGPSLADRALAADICLFSVVGAIALLSLRLDSPVFLDVVVGATLLGFLATVSLSRLIGRSKP